MASRSTRTRTWGCMEHQPRRLLWIRHRFLTQVQSTKTQPAGCDTGWHIATRPFAAAGPSRVHLSFGWCTHLLSPRRIFSYPPFLPPFLLFPGAEPFSAELVGSIAFPVHGGVYHFDCNWTEATMGYVWVDGHMICQDAHTYKPGAGTTVRHRIRYTKAAAMQKSRS